MDDKYKQIKEFKDYFIDIDGNVIKNNYKSRVNHSGKIMNIKPFKKANGYLSVSLYIKEDKINYKRYIHRLVAQTFISNHNNYPVVNHIDGNKQNNNVSNLEWCTYSYNVKHAYKNNLMRLIYGSDHKCSKSYVETDLEYNYIRKFTGSKEEERKLSYTRDSISKCARGDTLKLKNYIYLFEEEYFEDNKEKTKEIHFKRHLDKLNKRKNKKFERSRKEEIE